MSAIIARRHLSAARSEAHLSFIALGETGTGKTAVGCLVCHLLGLDPVAAAVHVPAETAGSLLGRREAREGVAEEGEGGERWRFVPGPATRLPFVLLDEFDKADHPTRRAAWPYLDGRLRVQAEGQVHELLPTPLLAANPPAKGERYADLRPEYRRRAVVLDTGFMRGRGRDLERLLRAFYAASGPADRLALDRLVPPTELHPDALQVLDTIPDCLTDAGREEYPGTRALELATLGRCALLGTDANHVGAAIQTTIAYLVVTATVAGQVVPGWGLDIGAMRDYLGDGGQADHIEAAIQRARESADARTAEVGEQRRSTRRASLVVIEAGAALQAELEQLRDALSGRRLRPEHRARAAGLRKVIRQLAESAGRVTTLTGLEDVAAAAADPMVRARALLAEDAQAREMEARQRREAREADRLSVGQAEADAAQLRQWQREQEKANRAHALEALGDVVAQAQELEALWRRSATRPGEEPLRVLADALVGGRALLTYRPPNRREPARGLRGVVEAFAPASTGAWLTVGGGPAFTGTPTTCPALSSWGPNTRAVLAPLLRHLHQAEDDLRARLGRARRQTRPVIAGVAPALPPSRDLRALAGR